MKRDPVIEFLTAEFRRKKARNSSYSLRSFSKYLEIDVSNLSKILSYRKEIGPSLKRRLAKRIGLSEEELSALESYDSEISDFSYATHPIEAFQTIADWQHYAILELLKIEGPKPKYSQLARRLGISVIEVQKAILRLISVGLIAKTAEGEYILADSSSSSILLSSTSKAHREQQRQILDGAIAALENSPIEVRSQSSMTMAIDTDRLEEARELIKKFRREMGRLLSDSKSLNEVYQLSVSLYPVTTSEKL